MKLSFSVVDVSEVLMVLRFWWGAKFRVFLNIL
jgi:hypothetical protein